MIEQTRHTDKEQFYNLWQPRTVWFKDEEQGLTSVFSRLLNFGPRFRKQLYKLSFCPTNLSLILYKENIFAHSSFCWHQHDYLWLLIPGSNYTPLIVQYFNDQSRLWHKCMWHSVPKPKFVLDEMHSDSILTQPLRPGYALRYLVQDSSRSFCFFHLQLRLQYLTSQPYFKISRIVW